MLPAAALLAGCNLPRQFDGARPAAVSVQPGESLLDIARRYDVSMTELIELNGIQAPYQVAVGQRIALPQPGGYAGTVPSTLPPATVPPVVATAPTTSPAPGTTGYGVTTPVPPLPQPASTASGLPPASTAPASILPGSVAPATPSLPTPPAGTATAGSAGADAGVTVAPLPPPTGAPQGTSGVAATGTATTPPAPSGGGSALSWPVTGSILVGYNAPLAGRANQGINIAAASGTPVRAAAGGTVAYAGNELRGYGNLVLIRHANNLVTAYAHLGQIDVTKDQTIQAGQIIGTVGQTGGVDQPQLHFEVREGSTPVDPARYLP